jgi:type IV secretory pathway component VirB8
MEEISMARTGLFSSNKSILILVACICFAIAVLTAAGVVSLGKISWTDLGLFFGFLSFLF